MGLGPNYVNSPRGAVQSLGFVWNVSTLEWEPASSSSGGPSADVNLAKVGGTNVSGANVVDGPNSALRVNVVASVVGGGGGTQYAEDTASTAAEQLMMAGVVRQDTRGTLVNADGDRTELQVNSSGDLRIDGSATTQPISVASLPLPSGAATSANQTTEIASLANLDVALSTRLKPADTLAAVTSITNVVHVDDNLGSLTVDNTNLDVALSTRLKPADTLSAVTTVGTITNVVHVDDNASSLTVDNANLDVALSTRLKPADTLAAVTTVGTITNVVHIDDNAGSVTVDGTVAVSGSVGVTGPLTDTQLRATPVPVSGTVTIQDGGNVISVDDAAGSLTIDGTVGATQSGTWNIGTLTSVTNVVHVDDNGSSISIDDGAGSITIDGSVSVSNLPAVQPVSDNGGSLTVDGPLTDTELRASPVAVTGSFSASTAADVKTYDGDAGYSDGDVGKNLIQTPDGRLRTLMGAVVSLIPSNFADGATKTPIMTPEGRLKVTTSDEVLGQLLYESRIQTQAFLTMLEILASTNQSYSRDDLIDQLDEEQS